MERVRAIAVSNKISVMFVISCLPLEEAYLLPLLNCGKRGIAILEAMSC